MRSWLRMSFLALGLCVVYFAAASRAQLHAEPPCCSSAPPDASKSTVSIWGVGTNNQNLVAGTSAPADGRTEIWIQVVIKDASGMQLYGPKNVALKAQDPNSPVQIVQAGPFCFSACTTWLVSSKVPVPSVTLYAVDLTDSITLNQTLTVSFTQPTPPPPPTPTPAGLGKVDPKTSNVFVKGVRLPANRDYIVPGTSAPADGQSQIWVEVDLRDPVGNPVLGKSIDLRPQEPFSGAQIVHAAQAMPDGSMVFSVTSTQPGQMSLSGYDTTDSITLAKTVTISFTKPPPTPSPPPTPRPRPTPVSAEHPDVHPSAAPATQNCAPHGMNEIVDESVGRFFCFAGLNLRVDSVQAIDKADQSPLLTKNLNTQADPDLGYIVVRVTMQNRSAGHKQNYPGNWLGFDLADGSKIEPGVVSAEYAGPALSTPPNELDPGQSLQITYVVVNWNRSPIRTMYLVRNVGDADNDPGVQSARFSLNH